MSHIFQIELNNFRAFKEKTFFEFANISVLTGTNSSGKSSLINALTILKNYFKDVNSSDESINFFGINSLLELDVKDVGERLGNFSKILNNKTGSQTLSITIPTLFRGIIDKIELRLSIELFSNDLHTGHLTHLEFFSQKSNSPVFSILNKESLEVFINYKYFWTEFKRESRQMLRYFSVEERYELELKRKFPEVKEYYQRDKEYFDIIAAKIEELKSVHFDYYQADRYDIFYSTNEGTISDLKSTYMPYFIHDENSKEFYDENLPLFPVDHDLLAALVPQQKDLPFQNIEIKPLEEQFLENFRFSIKENNPSKPYRLSSVFYSLKDPRGIVAGSSYVVPDNIRENPLSKYFMNYVPHSDSELDRSGSNSTFFFKDFVVENLKEAISFSTLGIKQSYNLPSIRNSVSRVYSIHREEHEFIKILNAFVRNKAFEKEEIKRFIDKYLEVFEIGSTVVIESDEGVSNKVYILRDKQKILLADLGYGVSQVLPIILQIGNVAFDNYNGGDFHPSTIIIEEPETNLHPGLQSRIADLLVSANKELNIQFIIETHSEYLIRKLQYLTAKTESGLKPEDTVIYYFHHPEKVPVGEKQVKKINIQQDGSLTDDFGTGFFDEADKIAMSIWNMNKATKN